MSDFLTIADILAIHHNLIERYGGVHGLRDEGQLEAALFRPQTGYYDDVIAEAAALWESLSQNHPFLDGNKRTAFAAALTFLGINGVGITATADETIAFLAPLYDRSDLSFEELDGWLRRNTRER